MAAGNHFLGDIFSEQHRRRERDGERAVPLFLGDVEDVLVIGNGGIIDQDIDAAEIRDHRFYGGDDLGFFGDVADIGFGLAAGTGNVSDDFVAAGFVHIDDGDRRAFRGQELGHRFADIAASTGDDGDTVCKFHERVPDCMWRVPQEERGSDPSP